MTCRELITFLLEYVSSEQPSSEHAQFEAHLDECPDRIAYLKSYQMTTKLGRRPMRTQSSTRLYLKTPLKN